MQLRSKGSSERLGVGEMAPRMQSAGTAGIVAGIALAVAFVLFLTSGLTQVLGDPAKALDYFTKNAGRLQLMTALFVITVAFAVVFVVGLAAKLHDRTPTRASATLYFGLLGWPESLSPSPSSSFLPAG